VAQFSPAFCGQLVLKNPAKLQAFCWQRPGWQIVPRMQSLISWRIAVPPLGCGDKRGFFSRGIVMAGSVNKVILVGNLGRDPEVRHTQAGGLIVQLSLATSENWRDKASGERKERTEWHRVVIFNEKMAEVAQKYLRKGAKIYVEGQLQTRKWTDQSGVEKYTTEVVLPRFGGTMTMLDGRSGGGGDPGDDFGGGGGSSSGGGGSDRGPAPTRGDMDDDIPF